MKIVFWGNENRGVSCLRKLHDAGYKIDLVVTHPNKDKQWYASVSELADQLNIKTIDPANPNVKDVETSLREYDSDLFILAGYGKILKPNIIGIPSIMCINLHGGKLPKYRGSSPMNWVLINGENAFTLSIVKLDAGIDSGEILLERTFEISINDTIRDLHSIATEQFPLMLIEAVASIEDDSYRLKKQDNSQGSYYPLRFPDDGLILWDIFTAEQIHNRIRALAEPYPCAFTFYNGQRVKLISSELSDSNYFGEPGRVYKKSRKGLLICAMDKCLWIKQAVLEGSEKESLFNVISRYDKMATIRGAVLENQNLHS